MKRIRKTFSFYLSVFLLLAFSAVFLPLDVFHNHAPIPQSSATEKLNSTTSHELNVQNKVDYCWVCAVHFDKTFNKSSFVEKIRLLPVMSVFLNNEVTGYVVELLLSNENKVYTKKGRLNKSGACRILNCKPKELEEMLLRCRDILKNIY